MNKLSSRKKWLALGAAAGVTAALFRRRRKKRAVQKRRELSPQAHGDRRVYFIGGGLASLAGAAYLLRDCHFRGDHIHIFEGLPVPGGSNDGSGNPAEGFVCRGGRMLNEETYENFWELFSSIPSLECPGKSVTEEILRFDSQHPTRAQARLIDRSGKILDVRSMGFTNAHRATLAKLLITPETQLDDRTIEDWFGELPDFFTTNFWHMWQTTFAFQKWSSLFEFKRYMERMIFEFPRIETLEGVTRTRYNQYESVILPLKTHLERHGVQIMTDTVVTDLDFAPGSGITVTAIHTERAGDARILQLRPGDVCIMTNGCMTDNAALGDFHTPPKYCPNYPISAQLWEKVAQKKPELGNPAPFFNHPDQTNWISFTVTCRGNALLKEIERFSGNAPGSGALMTWKDSPWLLSIVVAAQPHFKNQPPDTTIFWGYGLYSNAVGNYVKKPLRDCSGKDILVELLHQLQLGDQMDTLLPTVVNVIPCMMPYTDAQFQPHKLTDRPAVVPPGATNFALIGQFVEIPEDMVFTEEYSVRAARIAVYTLFGVSHKKIRPVTPYKNNPKVLKRALEAAFR